MMRHDSQQTLQGQGVTGSQNNKARDERRRLNLQRHLSRLNLFFKVLSQRFEQSSILVITNLPLDESRGAAGPSPPPRPHPGDERRELPPQAQPGDRRLSASRQPRRRLAHTDTLSYLAPRTVAIPSACSPRSSGWWYTIPPPQWPNFSVPPAPSPMNSSPGRVQLTDGSGHFDRSYLPPRKRGMGEVSQCALVSKFFVGSV